MTQSRPWRSQIAVRKNKLNYQYSATTQITHLAATSQVAYKLDSLVNQVQIMSRNEGHADMDQVKRESWVPK